MRRLMLALKGYTQLNRTWHCAWVLAKR